MSATFYDVRDRVAYLTLNRPGALNAIDEAMLKALGEALARTRSDDDVKALVIAGQGRAFCAGLDLGLLERAFADPPYFHDVLERFKAVLLQIEALPVPVIAAVEGVARAGGFELMLACDIAIVAEDARIGDNHLAFGIVPGGGSTQRLARVVGRQRAREIVFTGRFVDGAEAAAIGLAARSVPRLQLSDAVEEMASSFRTRSRDALAATKAAMNAADELPLRQGLDAETDQFMRYLTGSSGAAEGFRAWVERRDPMWP